MSAGIIEGDFAGDKITRGKAEMAINSGELQQELRQAQDELASCSSQPPKRMQGIVQSRKKTSSIAPINRMVDLYRRVSIIAVQSVGGNFTLAKGYRIIPTDEFL